MAEQLWSDEELREALAEYAHSAWSGWMRYMFGKGQTRQINIDGGTQTYWLMPAEFFHRWHRQMKTPYADLPESEKKSDRKEADEILAIVRQAALDAANQRVQELERELAETRTRLSGAESAWDTIENLMMGVDDDE